MTEALYERYKDALRRGHVAALRGRLEQALAAYADAAEIATDRPLPWASIGSVRLRMGDAGEALAAYDAALARAPRDEAALLGRAEALVRLNRRARAADALDLAADLQHQAGRQPEALDTARRALELAESKARRRYVEALARELRGASDLDQEAELALARALQILEPPAVIEAPVEALAEVPGDTVAGTGDGADEGRAAAIEAGDAPTSPDVDASAEVSEAGPSATGNAEGAGTEPTTGGSVGEPEVVALPHGEAEAPAPPPPAAPALALPARDPMALRAEADDALDSGDEEHARSALLEAARAHAASGQYDAAIDACHLALMVAPGNPDLHLELVDLYLLRGWHETAAEKLLLLDRLLDLDGNDASRARLRAIVVAAFPDEPSLAEIRS